MDDFPVTQGESPQRPTWLRKCFDATKTRVLASRESKLAVLSQCSAVIEDRTSFGAKPFPGCGSRMARRRRGGYEPRVARRWCTYGDERRPKLRVDRVTGPFAWVRRTRSLARSRFDHPAWRPDFGLMP